MLPPLYDHPPLPPLPAQPSHVASSNNSHTSSLTSSTISLSLSPAPPQVSPTKHQALSRLRSSFHPSPIFHLFMPPKNYPISESDGCCLSILPLASRQYSGEISVITDRRPSSSAAMPTVPDPPKGSNTVAGTLPASHAQDGSQPVVFVSMTGPIRMSYSPDSDCVMPLCLPSGIFPERPLPLSNFTFFSTCLTPRCAAARAHAGRRRARQDATLRQRGRKSCEMGTRKRKSGNFPDVTGGWRLAWCSARLCLYRAALLEPGDHRAVPQHHEEVLTLDGGSAPRPHRRSIAAFSSAGTPSRGPTWADPSRSRA